MGTWRGDGRGVSGERRECRRREGSVYVVVTAEVLLDITEAIAGVADSRISDSSRFRKERTWRGD